MTTTDLTVKGMTCRSCEQRLTRALTGLEGVRWARADREAERVVVEHDPARADVQALRARIVDAGFDVA